jgi:hypothetical protein
VLAVGDRTTSSSSRILGASVNDLKTTFRDGIAVEGAIVRVEVPIGRALDAQTLHEIDRLNLTLRDLTRHAQRWHLGASGHLTGHSRERVEPLHSAETRRSLSRSRGTTRIRNDTWSE